MQSMMDDLKSVVSPLVTLCPPAGGATGAAPRTEAEASRLYAVQDIPAGMVLLSVPTDAAFFAQPPPASDALLHYFMQVEDLVGQLVAAGESPDGASHHRYVEYLRESVVPCRNLPFLRRKDLAALLQPNPAGGEAVEERERGEDGGRAASPATVLYEFFHTEMGREPLSPYLRERLDADAYSWWVSLVLSRRSGAATLLPLVDKLNHSPVPNCCVTMSSAETLCGLDLLDNAIAAVPAELLGQPYVHVSAMRDLRRGEELTLCYASASEGLYTTASSGRPPPPPAQATSEAVEELARDTAPLDFASEAELVAFARRHAHRGKQEVETPEGRAAWQLQWGFVPPCDSVFSARDLKQMALLVAEKRINTRTELFPLPKKSQQ